MPLNKNMSKDDIIREIMRKYKRTGKIGTSTPKNKKEAIKQALAIAYETKKDEDLKNNTSSGIIKNIRDSISMITNSESFSDVISKYGKDTPHFMLDRIQSNLNRRGFYLEYDDDGDYFDLTITRNNKPVKELRVLKSRIADNEITDKELI